MDMIRDMMDQGLAFLVMLPVLVLYHKPEVPSANMQDGPLLPGRERLIHLATLLPDRLASWQIQRLLVVLPFLACLRLSTSCSGTDGPALVFQAIAAAIRERVGSDNLSDVFSPLHAIHI